MKKSFQKAHRQREGGIQYKHDLGQHFLYDRALLASLVASTGVTQQDDVLEIGPGSGMLTECLCQSARRVIAVEVDEAVLPFLHVTLEPYQNVTVIQGDIRKQDLSRLCEPFSGGFYVIANIPYNITTPIFELLWNSGLPIRQISVMIQKEVAQKLMAAPGDEGYGLLSVQCQYYTEPQWVQTVPAEAFTPPPKVDSAFVNLRMRTEPPLPVMNQHRLFQFVKAGFGMRRKTLCNALKGVLPPGFNFSELLVQLGFSPTVRGEALDVQDWIRLANACEERLVSSSPI